MTSIKELFQNQQVGITVYSPDCAQSRLWGNLDHAIHEATGFEVVSRQWINHDFNSIMRFYSGDEEPPPEQDPVEAAHKYDTVPVETLQYGHLVVKLFLSGPSLLTLWRGDNAVETLLTMKGTTHPSESPAGSIRGSFWCDNGVCNLLHSSDSLAEAERELGAVKLLHLLDGEATSLSLIEPLPTPTDSLAHSGIATVCELVNRILITTGITERLEMILPESGDARETNQVLTALLQETSQKFPESPIADFINAYLMGDLIKVIHLTQYACEWVEQGAEAHRHQPKVREPKASAKKRATFCERIFEPSAESRQ